MSERYETFDLFLNKFITGLRELGQEIDDNELIIFLTNESEAAAKIHGEDSVICRQKSWYLYGLIQSTDAAAKEKAREQRVGASSSGPSSRVVAPSLPVASERGRGRGRGRETGRERGRGRT